jgi:hypothetical protein
VRQLISVTTSWVHDDKQTPGGGVNNNDVAIGVTDTTDMLGRRLNIDSAGSAARTDAIRLPI